MAKRILSYNLLLIAAVSLFAQEFPARTAKLEKVFPIGDSELALGYRYFRDGTYDGSPTAFCFDSDGNLVINDWINKRISYFDYNLKPIKTIVLAEPITPIKMEFDHEGNLICHYIGKAIQKLDSEGKELFFVKIMESEIKNSIRNDGFFIVDDLVFANKRTPEGGFIGFVNPGSDYKDNNRHILNTQEVIREIDLNHPSLRVETRTESIIQQRNSTRGPIVPTRKKEEYVIYENGVELTRDFDSFMESNERQGALQSKSFSGDNQYSILLDRLEYANKMFIGTDLDGNKYWTIGNGIVVFDSAGTPISAFKFVSLDKRTTRPVVSPSGDVYYMFSDKTGHYLYKYKRDW